MTISPSRRDVLRKAGLAGSLIAIPGIGGALVNRAEAGVCTLPEDPIFALIERHRAAQSIAGKEEAEMSDEEIRPFLEAELQAFAVLIDTPPTTLDGAIAFVGYLPEARGTALRLDEDESERAFAALLTGLRIIATRRP